MARASIRAASSPNAMRSGTKTLLARVLDTRPVEVGIDVIANPDSLVIENLERLLNRQRRRRAGRHVGFQDVQALRVQEDSHPGLRLVRVHQINLVPLDA